MCASPPAMRSHSSAQRSQASAQRYAEAAGYTYTRYMITGGMHDWAGSLGIAAFTPELWTGEGSDTEANHTALHAILAQAEALLPLPEDQQVGAFVVPAPIWRFWRSLGGAERWGAPIAPAHVEDGRIVQAFRRAVIAADPERADTTAFVALEPLGAQVRALFPTGTRSTGATGRYDDLFATAAAHLGGEAILGTPLARPGPGISLRDGAPRVVQYFASARLELDPTADEPSVQLSPLGWYAQQLAALTAPTFTHQIR